MNADFEFLLPITPTSDEGKLLYAVQRGFKYGDGLFETMFYRQGSIVYLHEHLTRLKKGMQALHLLIPEALIGQNILAAVEQYIKQQNWDDDGIYRVKLYAIRKSGGFYTPSSEESTLLLEVLPQNNYPAIHQKKISGLSHNVRLQASLISPYKTISALPYVLAGIEQAMYGWDEIIILSYEGFLAEAGASNIFWWDGSCLYTPSLASGCIDGIIRGALMDFSKSIRLPVVEGLFLPQVLQKAQMLFTTNSAGIGIIACLQAPDLHLDFSINSALKAPKWLIDFGQAMNW